MSIDKVLQMGEGIAGEAREAGGPRRQLPMRLAICYQKGGCHERGAQPCQILVLGHHLRQACQILQALRRLRLHDLHAQLQHL